MSSRIQNKMYNYEVLPPAALWEKITSALDESVQTQKITIKLQAIEIAPPERAWQSIVTVLDQSVMENDYAEKLTGIQITPPLNVWTKITNTLNADNEIAISEKRKISPLLKYAAAAIITGVVAWGGFQLYSTKSSESVVAKQDTSLPANFTETATNTNMVDENIAIPDITASIEEARNDAALEASKKTFAKLDVTVNRSKIKNAADFFFESANDETAGIRGFEIDPPATPSVDISNRYIILMTPDGNIIRMSKKLKELVCCVSGEDQDKDCVDQMKKWRENIGNPSTTHSSSSFIDILNMVKCMQEY